MGYMKDRHLARIEAGGSCAEHRPSDGVQATVEACLALLGDRSEAARHALTAKLDLAAAPADLRRKINSRCWEIVSLFGADNTARAQAIAAADPAACAPHIAYAARRLAARLAGHTIIPLVVDGQVVAHASDAPEADRWLARFEGAL